MPEQSVVKKIIWGTFVVLFFWMFWKLGGLLLSVIIGYLYPPGREPAADAYSHVFKYIIFTFIYSASLRVLVPAFMPVFIERIKEDGDRKAWEFAYSVINIMVIITMLGSAAAIIFAPQIINLLVPGFSPEARALGISLLQIMLPGSVGMVLSMVMMAILNSYKNFSYPAASDAAQKLFWAVALFAGVKLLNLDARIIGYGFLAGCIVQVLINVYGLRSYANFYKPKITTPSLRVFLREMGIVAAFAAVFGIILFALRGKLHSTPDQPSLGQLIVFTAALVLTSLYVALLHWRTRNSKTTAARFAALAAPLLIGVLFSSFRDVATSFFQSFTQMGVYASVEFAKNVGNFPTVLVAYGLSIAMFPYLCELAAGKDMETFADIVTKALRMIALFFIPVSILMILLDRPIISLVYDRGNWTEHHIAYAGTALSLFVVGLFFYAAEGVVTRAYFSIQRMWMPTFLGLIFSTLQVVFLVVAIMMLGYSHPHHIFMAVAIVFPLTRIFKNIALLAVLRVHVPIVPLRETIIFAGKLAVACIAFAVVVKYSHLAVDSVLPPRDFRKMDVAVDTFSINGTKWVSRETDSLQIEHEDAHGSALVARYRTLPNEKISIDRELNMFRLDGVRSLELVAKASQPRELAVEIVYPKSLWKSEPYSLSTEWRQLSIDLPEKDLRPVELRIVLPPGQVLKPDGSPEREQHLFIGEVRFSGERRDYLIDSFGLASSWTTPGSGKSVLASYDTKEKSRAVAFGNEGARLNVGAYDLAQTAGVRFSVKPQSPGRLGVTLTDTAGDSAQKIFEVTDGDEQEFSTEYSSFEGSIDTGNIEWLQLAFEPDGVLERQSPVLLNSFLFTAPRGFFRDISPVFEAVKLIGVAVPSLLGGIIFIILVFALKIEEGSLVLNWLREQIRARLPKLRKTTAS